MELNKIHIRRLFTFLAFGVSENCLPLDTFQKAGKRRRNEKSLTKYELL